MPHCEIGSFWRSWKWKYFASWLGKRNWFCTLFGNKDIFSLIGLNCDHTVPYYQKSKDDLTPIQFDYPDNLTLQTIWHHSEIFHIISFIYIISIPTKFGCATKQNNWFTRRSQAPFYWHSFFRLPFTFTKVLMFLSKRQNTFILIAKSIRLRQNSKNLLSPILIHRDKKKHMY